MTEHDDNVRDAEQSLAGRIAEMRAFLAAGEGVDLNDSDARDEYGEHASELLDGYEDASDAVYSYGLEWTKAITDHRAGTVTYVHVLSTGGPHDQFDVTFDPHKGTVDGATFVYLPWFDRVEIDLFKEGKYVAFNADVTGRGDAVDVVTDFYETFYGDLVTMDSEDGR